ncbi:hypothetical protein QR680_002311 [Steinernema hermaphroditum]|uniref:C-factor n=1 Tax=Steinernema hermaphroditum TaxID=289476 RepID=A0AA39H275_9BILA|nr:hypothetical protein QR680_002311 [Steinernema hermaphroditum]
MSINVVITGANRGIGFALVQEFSEDDELKNMFACCRNPVDAEQLKALASTDSRIHLIRMDVSDPISISKAAQEVEKLVGSDGVNLLINNAGTNEGHCTDGPQSFLGAEQQTYLKIYNVNAIGPVIVSKEFLPLLKTASQKYSDKEVLNVKRAAIVNVSSGLASISSNTTGSSSFPNVAYRCSKTALNQFTKTAAVDLADKGILVVSCCPGWVRTDMGGPYAPINASESAKCLLATFSRFDKSSSGGFFNLSGERENY